MDNSERIRIALDDVREALTPFVADWLREEYGDDDYLAHYAVPDWTKDEFNADVQVLTNTIVNNWDDVFSKCMSRESKHMVHQVRKTRNRFAHQEKFDDSDTYTALHEMQRLLEAVGSDASKTIDASKDELLGTMAVDSDEALKRADAALARGASDGCDEPARLILIRGGHLTEPVFDFGLPAVIGRKDGQASVVEVDLSDIEEGAYISRRHASISIEDGAAVLEDLGSSNGTYVLRGDYERVTKTEIVDGDQVVFGNAKFVFRLPC